MRTAHFNRHLETEGLPLDLGIVSASGVGEEGCRPLGQGVYTPLGNVNINPALGRHPLPIVYWDTPPCPLHAEDTHPPTHCMLGYIPLVNRMTDRQV